MPVRRMTPQERKEWLGSGIVLSGIKRPEKSPQPSTDTSKELKELKEQELAEEPSLAGMLDLNNPKVLAGLGKPAKQAQERARSSKK